jgi:hypothetical protein
MAQTGWNLNAKVLIQTAETRKTLSGKVEPKTEVARRECKVATRPEKGKGFRQKTASGIGPTRNP